MAISVVNFCWLFIGLISSANGEINDRKLLIISLDAFKPDYLNMNITPSMETFYQNGIIATSMDNQFPTKTLVNHFSISTG